MKHLFIKFGGIVASFGLLITTINANTNCICFLYQPALPEKAKGLRKF